MSIDLDQGVTKRNSPEGITVVMYKNKPGVFYDNRGTLVSDAIAAKAGFNVEQLRREQKRRNLLKDYSDKLAAQYAAEEQRLAMEASEGLDTVEIRAIGNDYALFDRATGERLTSVPLTIEAAKELAQLYTEVSDDDAGNQTDAQAEAAESKAPRKRGRQAAGSQSGAAATASEAEQAGAGAQSLTD